MYRRFKKRYTTPPQAAPHGDAEPQSRGPHDLKQLAASKGSKRYFTVVERVSIVEHNENPFRFLVFTWLMVFYYYMSSEQKTNTGATAPKIRTQARSGGKENWYLRKKDSKKRYQWRAERSSARKFKPHFGVEVLSDLTTQFQSLAEFANVDLPDNLVRKVEGVVALLLNLQYCNTYQHFISAIFLYIRDFYDESITKQVMAYIEGVIMTGDFKQQDNREPPWLDMIRNLQTNWTLVKGNRAFKQLSKLMGVLVTLGLCDVADLKFDVAGFRMFDEEIMKKHMSAYDLADAVFGTVTYFAEGAYLCFKTKSIQPLLLNDFSILELDEEYTNIITWWDLVKNGNLERIVGMSDAEFGHRLDAMIAKLSNLMAGLVGLDKRLVGDKVTKCKTIRNDMITFKISSGTRRSPFSIELFGDSSQGKTTFGDQLIDALLTSNELPIDKQYRAALNPGDKFFSNWTSDKIVAILDDLANEKADFVERPPTRAIIDICNNQMYYAPKAELEAKGKCFVEPEIVLVTTNKKDLDAHAYSNCPYSIQRRMDLVMTVRCKNEFQRVSEGITCGVDSQKVREHYTINGEYAPPVIDDIWEITVEQAVRPGKLTTVAGYAPITYRGQKMVNVSASLAIQCAIEHMSVHRRNQKAIMEHMRRRVKVMKKCTHIGCCHLEGFCPDHSKEMGKQFGLQTAVALESIRRRVIRKVKSDTFNFTDKLESAVTKCLYKKTNEFLSKWDWICIIPEPYLENEHFIDFVHWYYKDDVENKISTMSWLTRFLCVILIFLHWQLGLSFTLFMYLTGLVVKKSQTKQYLISELRRRNDSLPFIIRNTRDKYAKALCYGSASIAVLYILARVYKSYKSLRREQGSLEPTTPSQVQERDEESNVWASVVKRELPTTKYSKSTTPDRLVDAVSGNLLYATIHTDDKPLMANVLMLKSNILLIPNHYFEHGESLRLTCRKVNADAIGGKFDTRICRTSSIHVEDTDFSICYTASGGSFRDLTKFLPLDRVSNHPFKMLWRRKSGEMLEAHGLAIAKDTTNSTCVFKGGDYKNLTINTFGGLCGATLISQTKAATITGFHLGGHEGTPQGCFGTLTYGEALFAINQLKCVEGVVVSGSGEKFTPQMLGKSIITDDPLHPKSPLNFLPENSQFAYYGSCPGMVTSRSDVRRTPISDIVTEVTGVQNIWGAPKMKPEWFGWQTCLANASHPGKPFPHELLKVSIVDYKTPLVEKAREAMWQRQPLSDHENLNGIPGCKFIDSINLSTSIGYPLTGSKRKFVTELEPTECAPSNRIFDDVILDEIKRVEDHYKNGERAFTVAKACKKDEVLPVAKGKCRIFYGNPIALTFLVRKYYLPVLRFLQMNPLLSECAVGINCHGTEWDEFYKHAIHFGTDRLFGGDYGKYDQKLPSQLLLAALRILIDISKEMGYSHEDREIMSAMTGDIVYSLIAVNGDLIGLQSGTHISGNSLTVILNGICGSLNLRNYFYTQYPSSVNFRKAAHMMTYGDDNIGSVSPLYPKFNIKGCSEFLADYGQVYTMPDKESALKSYLPPDEFEFLKRFSVYHPKLGVEIGALLDKSIFKSLHCYMRPRGCPLTPDEACAQNIDTALREWFNHGESVYEMRRKQMNDIAKRANISHMCVMLNETYDERCDEWKLNYRDVVDV